VGIELSATHHRACRGGTVFGLASALHLGRSLASYEITVHDPAGRLLSSARLTCMLLDDPANAGSDQGSQRTLPQFPQVNELD
jgi:acyl-coenzyme A thioesterase PaaI-like protein